MYFSYFDESGDPGLTGSKTRTFCLSCILINDRDWFSSLDFIRSFRLHIRRKYGVPRNCELKGAWLYNGNGSFRNLNLSFKQRMSIYRTAMRMQKKCGIIKTFSIVIAKDRISKRDLDVWEIAWRFAIQRLERFGTQRDTQENAHIIADAGYEGQLRTLVRSMRRFNVVKSAFTNDYIRCNAVNLLEDPSFRISGISHFIQFADLNAYASFRHEFPDRDFDGRYWGYLGDCRLEAVNDVRGGPVGIVNWPK